MGKSGGTGSEQPTYAVHVIMVHRSAFVAGFPQGTFTARWSFLANRSALLVIRSDEIESDLEVKRQRLL